MFCYHGLRAPVVRTGARPTRSWDRRTSKSRNVTYSRRLSSQLAFLTKSHTGTSHSGPSWLSAKTALLGKLRESSRIVSQSAPSDAAVVLVSKDYHQLLGDGDVIPELLRVLFTTATRGSLSKPDISILYGVVDAVTPRGQLDYSGSGVSILCGASDSILPGLWAEETSRNVDDELGSLRFQLNPLPGSPVPTLVTLPLANTVFQTGQVSTLLASRWRETSPGSYSLTHSTRKHRQRVMIPPSSAAGTAKTRIVVPLQPITPRRTIVSGLGNIVRQVEVDGRPAPASAELEANINEYVRQRSRGAHGGGPIKVWAWVVPPGVDISPVEGVAGQRGALSFAEGIAQGGRLHRVRK